MISMANSTYQEENTDNDQEVAVLILVIMGGQKNNYEGKE